MDQVRRLTRDPLAQPVMPSVLEPVHRPTDLDHKGVVRTGGWRKGPKGAANRQGKWNTRTWKCPRVPSLILGVCASTENLLLHLKCPKHDGNKTPQLPGVS